MKYLCGFLVIVLLKFVLNLSKFLSAKWLRNKYIDSLTKNESFSEYIPQARRLFKGTKLEKTSISGVAPLGYGMVSSGPIPIIDNLDSRRKDVVGSALSLFDQLVGTYKIRMLESFSPRFWIEFIIFLPRNIVEYLGGASDGLLSKLLQIIYWIAAPLLLALRTHIYDFFLALIEKM